jgi:uncharacterized membrane protein YfcA
MNQRIMLLLGDWLVLILFVFIGQRDHNMSGPGTFTSLAITAVSLAVPWTLAAAALGAYRLEVNLNWQTWLGRALVAWLVAAPLGLLLRALLRGQGTIAVPFMLVVLGLGGLFVLGWRGVYYWLASRRRRPATAEAGN